MTKLASYFTASIVLVTVSGTALRAADGYLPSSKASQSAQWSDDFAPNSPGYDQFENNSYDQWSPRQRQPYRGLSGSYGNQFPNAFGGYQNPYRQGCRYRSARPVSPYGYDAGGYNNSGYGSRPGFNPGYGYPDDDTSFSQPFGTQGGFGLSPSYQQGYTPSFQNYGPAYAPQTNFPQPVFPTQSFPNQTYGDPYSSFNQSPKSLNPQPSFYNQQLNTYSQPLNSYRQPGNTYAPQTPSYNQPGANYYQQGPALSQPQLSPFYP